MKVTGRKIWNGIIIFLFLLVYQNAYCQNGKIGSGFGTNDWITTDGFAASAGNSRIGTFNANATGNSYFRLVTNWSGNFNQWGPSSVSADYQVIPGIEVPSSEIIENSTTKAYYINVGSTSYKYLFKTKEGGNPPINKGLIVFEVQGTVQIITSATTPGSTKYPGETYTVTATTSGSTTGQGYYLRYTTDNFTTSSIIAMAGSGTSYTATIPASAHAAGATIQYYVFSSGNGLTISHANADWYTINLSSTYSYTVASSSITAQNGLWSNPSTWLGGVVPPSGAPVIIAHNVTLDQDATVSSMTINSGKTFTSSDASPRNLTISSDVSGTTLTNNGTWANGAGAGTVSFSGTAIHTVSGTIGFFNVSTVTKVDFGSLSTINNYFRIDANGSVLNNAPYYGINSTLIYNTGSVFVAATEWYANYISGQGVPQNVQVGTSSVSGSGLSFGTNILWRQCNGNLTIGTSSGSGCSFLLSSNIGGDVKVGGNWNRYVNGTFTPNGRSVWFNGSSAQTIAVTGAGTNTETFSYLIINNPNASVTLSNTSGSLTDVSVDGNNSGTGDQLQLLSNGSLNLNGRILYLAGTPGGNILVSGGNRQMTGTTGSTLYIQSNKTVTSASGGTLVTDLLVTVKVENTAASTTIMNFGSSLTTINGILLLNYGYTIVNSPAYGPSSLLQYNCTGAPARGPEWMTSSGFGYPNDVQISNNTSLDPGGTSLRGTVLNLARDLTIDAGSSIYMDWGSDDMTLPLIVGRNFSMAGNLSLSNLSGGDIKVGGNWTHTTGTFVPNGRAVFFNGATGDQTITKSGGETFDFMIVTKATSGNALLANDITINQTLTLTKGLITTGSNKVTITSTGSIATASAASYINGILAQTYTATGSKTFPIGKGGFFRPLSFNYTALTGTSIVTTEQIELPQPGTMPGSIVPLGNRYWAISQSGGSSFTYFVTLDATGFPITGPVVMLKNESGINTSNATTASVPNYTNTTGFTTLVAPNYFALGEDCAVEVTATGGTLDACYSTLKAAFDAINAGTHTGVLTILIHGNTTEAATAVLNASGSGSASYTSVLMYPTITGLSITGNLASPLIDLNGADFVTINGSVLGTGSLIDLTISNTNSSATSGTSTIRLKADASNNNIINCSILGSGSMGLGTNGGNIFISTGTTTGNDNITISNCKIGPASANLPSKGIYGNGTTTSAAIANSNITITNCEIYDFFLNGGSAGVYALTGNTGWSITNNKIYQTATRTYTAIGAGTMTGIYFANATYGDNIQITGNTIGYASNSGSGILTLSGSTFAGAFQGIYLLALPTAASACNINNNFISDISLNSLGDFSGINSATTAGSNTINMNGNTIRNIATATTGNLYGIYTGGATTLSASNNTINNIARSGSGPFYGIDVGTAITCTISTNTITNLSTNVIGSSSTMYGIYLASPANITANGNTISNLSTPSTAAFTLRGITDIASGAGNKVYQNNVISNLSAGSGTATITGIYTNTASTPNPLDISGNKIYTFSGAATIYAINQASASTASNIYKNKIYDITGFGAGAVVDGIILSAGTTNNVYNNLIGDLYVPLANSVIPLAGIYASAGTTDNIYYNTVNLNATSAGALFGSAALFASTTPTVNLRNNIFVNTSTPNGAGLTCAYRRSNTTLTTYGATSNNNLFYAGTPSATRLIFSDGTNSDQTLAAYKTRVTPRDAVSISENPNWLSTAGANAAYLHINQVIPNGIDGGAAPIATVLDDYDGDTRSLTIPDIGADEMLCASALSGTVNVGSGQTYTTLTGIGGLFQAINTCGLSGNLTANITSDITEPGTVTLNQWTGVFTVTIQPDATMLRTLSGTAVATGSPMIGITGADRLTIDGGAGKYLRFRNTNATPANTGPTIQFDGGSTLCTLSNCDIENNGTTPTFGDIVIGSGTNSLTISGNNIHGATGGTLGNPYTAIYSNTSTNTLTITANNIYNWYVLGIYGLNLADNAIITNNSFYQTANCNYTGQYAIDMEAGNGHNISNNYIGGRSANCGGAAWTNSADVNFNAIWLAVGTATAASLQGNTIQNISLTNTNSGGAASTFNGINVTSGLVNVGTTTGNVIGHATNANSISIAGTNTTPTASNLISASNAAAASSVENNILANFTYTGTGTLSLYGVKLNGNARKNKIYNIGSSSLGATPLLFGIGVIGTGGGECSNNFIALSGGSATNPTIYGIYDNTATGAAYNIYYNSINITGSATTTSSTYAFYKGATSTTTYVVKDNIFSNTRTTGGTGKHYAIYASIAGTWTSDYNDLYTSAPATLGYWPAADRSFATWKSASGQDANSINVAPVFISGTDLHLNTILNDGINNLGTLLAAVPTDIDGATRDLSAPDMGADEFSCSPLSGTVNVGTGQTFTSLTAGNGLFAAINNCGLSGNLTVNITSDLTEDGTIALNQWVGAYTVTIQPDATTVRVISGTAVATGSPMISINGADGLTIDGGAGKYLLFRNTNAIPANTGPTLKFSNGSTFCTVTNCDIENNGTTAATARTILIGATLPNSVTISNNNIHDATGGTTGNPSIAIYSSANTNALTITDNNIYNWTSFGINAAAIADGAVITGNSFYMTGAATSTAQTSIRVNGNNNHVISNNNIGGSLPGCGGGAWVNNADVDFEGIYLSVGTTTATSL